MTNNTPNGTKKHCESTEWESRQTAKCFSFFFLFFFRRASSNLHDFHNGFCTKQQHFSTEQCTSPSKRAWSGQWFFGQYCVHLLWKPVRTDLLLCDGKLQLNHAPAAKTSYINKTKHSHCLVTDRTLIKSFLSPSTCHIKYWPINFTIEPVKNMKCYLLIKTVLY